MVPVHRQERGNRVYLVKDCKDCGTSETLISGNARVYNKKRSLMSSALQEGRGKKSCKINCSACNAHKVPSMVFLDITNRCNMNCPICINNTPSMGFTFDPPLNYFKKIFDHFGSLNPRPAIKLFGGEPTLREDLFEIINLAHDAGLRVAVITNGVRLADPDYCKQFLDSGVSVRLSFDGHNRRLYTDLRNSPQSLDSKLKAIENIGRFGKEKVTLMTMVAKGFNDHELPEFLDYCHSNSHTLGNICFMPLAHTWAKNRLSSTPERITSEDIESIIEQSVPGGKVEFLPAGILNHFPSLTKHLFKELPSFGGAHSNCESITFLVSNGSQFVSISNYINKSAFQVVENMKEKEATLAKRLGRLETGAVAGLLSGLGLKKPAERLMINASIAGLVLRNADFMSIFSSRGKFSAYFTSMKILGRIMTGTHPFRAFGRYSKAGNIIQVMVLPFEDKTNMESERLKHCPTHFAYIDPATDKVRTSPLCSWPLFKNDIMSKIAARYSSSKNNGNSELKDNAALQNK